MKRIIRLKNGVEIEKGLCKVDFRTRVFFTDGTGFETELTGRDCGDQSHFIIYRMIETADKVIEDNHTELILYHGHIKKAVYMKQQK